MECKLYKKKKLLIAPGGGFPEKCWGDENFNLLTNLLLKEDSLVISIIGSKEDRARIKIQESERLKNLCGSLSLRESAAMVSQSDFCDYKHLAVHAFSRCV